MSASDTPGDSDTNSEDEEALDMTDGIPIDDGDIDAAAVLNILRLESAQADEAPCESAPAADFASGLQAYSKVFFKRSEVKLLMKKKNLAEKQMVKYSTYSREFLVFSFYRISANPLDDNDKCTALLLHYLKMLTAQGKNPDGTPLLQADAKKIPLIGTAENLEKFLVDYFIPHRKRWILPVLM